MAGINPPFARRRIEPQPQDEPRRRPIPLHARESRSLFDLEEEEIAAPAKAGQEDGEVSGWIGGLLSSPVFDEQRKLVGKAVPPSEILSELLGALDRRGGRIAAVTLARALGLSPLRLRDLLTVAQRLLNIDGYPILTSDPTLEIVELNRDLLRRQFDLA